MAMLTKDQILKANDLETEIVDVPGWGGQVTVSTMSGTARDRFEAAIVNASGGVDTQNIRAKLAASTIVDEKGELLFSESDIKRLGKKSCAALDRIFEVSQRLNGMSDSDVEELAGN